MCSNFDHSEVGPRILGDRSKVGNCAVPAIDPLRLGWVREAVMVLGVVT